MSGAPETFEVRPDTEGILSVKQKLKEKECKDTVLLSNLDISERVFRHNPLNEAMTLQVKGQWQCLRIGKVGGVIYTVSSEDGKTCTDCRVYCDGDVVADADIKSIYFSVHSCQNQSRSCFTEAKDAVKSKHQALKITCNNFSITFTTKGVPDEIKMIETKCQFKLRYITAEGLLERKCWMEKEKANCQELVACLDFLIEKYLNNPEYPGSVCRFILQGNKEMAEIISENPCNKTMQQYIVICVKYHKVSIYPPLD